MGSHRRGPTGKAARIPPSTPFVTLLSLVAAATAVECRPMAPEARGVERFDSSGVEIVLNTIPPDQWTSPALSLQHEFTVGAFPDDSLHQLFRVAGAALLPEGRVVVANGGIELRFFGPSGVFQTATGRRGEGPGEFKAIGWIGSYRHDSVGVFDPALRRFSVFDLEGRYSRSFDLLLASGNVPGAPEVAGVFDNGAVLFRWSLSPPMRAGLVHQAELLTVYGASGDERFTLGQFSGEDIFFSPRPGGGMAFGPPPFSPKPQYVAAGERIFLTESTSYEVRIRNGQGQQELIARVDQEPQPITEAVIRGFLASRLARHHDPATRRKAEAELRSMVVYDFLPALTGLLADNEGGFWVRTRREGQSTSIWHRFSSTGVFLGPVELPSDAKVLDLRSGRIALLEGGRREEQLVRVFRLESDQIVQQ